MSIKILVVDDDPDIRDIIKITLSEDENYEIIEAADGEDGLNAIRTQSPDAVILDWQMPKMDGAEVCRQVKGDPILGHIPILMVTGKKEVEDRVGGLDSGADDYIVKPFDPQELLARIRMVLRRREKDIEANPLTQLPGNISILKELTKRIESKGLFCVCYSDLNNFKAFNDVYGFESGDRVIKETARIVVRAAKEQGGPNDFIGHIGGDDFVVITTPDKVDGICKKIIECFDAFVPSMYNETDRKNGFIISKDRQGTDRKFPLMGIAIGVVTNEYKKIENPVRVGELGAEMKHFAKQSSEKSYYLIDQRKE